MAKKQQMPTKSKVLRAPIESGSMSDVILHFLYMYSRTNVYQSPTSRDLWEMNSAKYKKMDNLEKALARLLKMGLIKSSGSNKHQKYYITEDGIECIYRLAMLRSRKDAVLKSSAGRKGTDIQYGYGLE